MLARYGNATTACEVAKKHARDHEPGSHFRRYWESVCEELRRGGVRVNPRRPGKFEGSGAIGEFLYALSMEWGVDEECGDSSGPGWAGLLYGPFPKEEMDELDPEEKHALGRSAGAIVFEDSQGFVDVEYEFPNQAKLYDRWHEVCESLGEYDEDEEED